MKEINNGRNTSTKPVPPIVRYEAMIVLPNITKFIRIKAVHVEVSITIIWHVPAKHANLMDARAHTSTLAECAPRFMTPRSQGFVGQSSPNLAHV